MNESTKYHITDRPGRLSIKFFEYTATVRGFDYFKTSGNKGNELLCCAFKKGNCYDRFTIKMCNENKRMIGHLPREVS